MGHRPGRAGLSGGETHRNEGDDDLSSAWGIVATIKAPQQAITWFAAYHLGVGAAHIWIFLDDPDAPVPAKVEQDPRITFLRCDAAFWSRRGGRRPDRHQVRQAGNASQALGLASKLDWLIHLDVDEFLHSDLPIGDLLADLGPEPLCARIRPFERLAGGDFYKAPVPAKHAEIGHDIYGRYVSALRRGLLSHVAGKMAFRTRIPDSAFRIHNVFAAGQMNPMQTELARTVILHHHADSWESWSEQFRFRLDKGAYRADQNPNTANPRHEALRRIWLDEGMTGLRRFFDAACADTPVLRDRLQRHGLLHRHTLFPSTALRETVTCRAAGRDAFDRARPF